VEWQTEQHLINTSRQPVEREAAGKRGIMECNICCEPRESKEINMFGICSICANRTVSVEPEPIADVIVDEWYSAPYVIDGCEYVDRVVYYTVSAPIVNKMIPVAC